jgi:hypothetical protein
MSFITVDNIARSWLLKKRYPMHWYIDAITHVKNFLMDVNMHSLQIVNTQIVSLNPDTKAGPLPCGYITWIRVGIQKGQYAMPLAKREGYVRHTATDASGNKIAHGPYEGPTVDFGGDSVEMLWMINRNKYGEHLGQHYGGLGDDNGFFNVFEERQEIQMSEEYTGETIYMDYLASINTVTAASRIPEECYTSALAYIDWQHEFNKKNRDMYAIRDAEAKYNGALRILRANRFDYGAEDIFDLWNASVNAGPK